MRTQFLELRAEALIQQINKSEMRQSDIARALKISRKTVQRWLNGSVSRTKIEQVEKLAEILNCSVENITQHENRLVVTQKNRILEGLLQEEFTHSLQTSQQWATFFDVLKKFEDTPLPTEQEARLYYHLGYIQFQGGRYRSSLRYLQECLTHSRTANVKALEVRALCQMSSVYRIQGKLNEATQCLSEAATLCFYLRDLSLESEVAFRQGKIHISNHDLEKAEEFFKRSLILESRAPTTTKRGLGLKYIYLGRIQVLKRNPKLALKYYQKGTFYARKYGMRRSETISHYGQALCSYFCGDLAGVKKGLRQARLIASTLEKFKTNQRLLHIEFNFAVLGKDFATAKALLHRRFQMNRQSKLLISETVRSALLLEKVSGGQYPARKTWTDLYKFYSRSVPIPNIQAQFRKLEKESSMAEKDALELAEFLIF